MLRRIIVIDREKCNGCGACAKACQEGAIAMVDGKAVLQREDYCDGLGDCLPNCPTQAITFIDKDVPFNIPPHLKNGDRCLGGQSRTLRGFAPASTAASQEPIQVPMEQTENKSQLLQWPVQIQLIPVHTPFFDGAKLLIAADCTAYACGDFHNRFMRDHVTLIGCGKLDKVDYSEKLTEIIRNNDIKSVSIVRMEVPCCGSLERAAVQALNDSGKIIPWQVVTISRDGDIIDAESKGGNDDGEFFDV